jgi:hypothetical protein
MATQLRSLTALASWAALALGTACVSQGEMLGPPYEVVVLDRVASAADGATSNASSAAAEPSFALRRRTLETVDDFALLSSPSFRVLQGGTLSVDVMSGDTISSGLFTGGDTPNLRYVVEDGVAMPRDYATLLMFSAAYQFERVSAGLRAASSANIRAALDSHGAMDTIFGPIIEVKAKGAKASIRMNTNAFFFSQSWQFGLAQSSPMERAPLAADARVIAHELGHAVFQLSFYEGETPTCDAAESSENEDDAWFEGRLEQELAVGGLNEGFADWMSFAITGGTNPIESIKVPADDSLTRNVAERLLTDDNFRWSQILKDGEKDQDDTRCDGKYCLGTLFARSLVASYLEAGNDADDAAARQEFSADVVRALEQAQASMRALTLPLPEAKVAHCEIRDAVSEQYDPPVIGAFLEAFLQGIPRDTQVSLCRQLSDRFEEGFPSEYRKGCAP